MYRNYEITITKVKFVLNGWLTLPPLKSRLCPHKSLEKNKNIDLDAFIQYRLLAWQIYRSECKNKNIMALNVIYPYGFFTLFSYYVFMIVLRFFGGFCGFYVVFLWFVVDILSMH